MFPHPVSFLGNADEAFSSTKSLAFDGVDDNISCGELPVTTTLTAFSFSLWVKVGSTTTRMNLTSSPYAASSWNDNFAVYYEAGTTSLKVEQGASVKYENTSTTLPVGTWTHLCFVFDASESTAATKSKCYINGVSILNASAALFVSLVDKDEDLYLGCRYLAANGSKSYFYDGNIDEVSFFNVALSSGDVSDIYNSGSPTDLTGESGLVSWYRMGENSTFSSPQILMPEQSNKDKVSNYSMAFDGVNDYVFVGNDSSLQPTAAITLSAWVNQKTADWADRGIINAMKYIYGSPNGYTLDASVRPDGYLYFNFEITTSAGVQNVKFLYLVGSYNLNEWYHYMATFDGNTLTAYVNGVVIGTTSYTGAILYDATFYGVNINGKPYRLMHADVDEVSIFNTAKAIGDIWDGSGKPTDLSGESGLVGYWKMGEEATYDAVASEWTIPDQAGSNDGTSANMTIEDRTGDAPDSENNALSYNMDAADIKTEAP